MEGLGIIDGDEVAEILERLKENRDEAESAEPEDLLYEAEPEEWMEAYDDLCSLYEDALSQKKGLLLTFWPIERILLKKECQNWIKECKLHELRK